MIYINDKEAKKVLNEFSKDELIEAFIDYAITCEDSFVVENSIVTLEEYYNVFMKK